MEAAPRSSDRWWTSAVKIQLARVAIVHKPASAVFGIGGCQLYTDLNRADTARGKLEPTLTNPPLFLPTMRIVVTPVTQPLRSTSTAGLACFWKGHTCCMPSGSCPEVPRHVPARQTYKARVASPGTSCHQRHPEHSHLSGSTLGLTCVWLLPGTRHGSHQVSADPIICAPGTCCTACRSGPAAAVRDTQSLGSHQNAFQPGRLAFAWPMCDCLQAQSSGSHQDVQSVGSHHTLQIS